MHLIITGAYGLVGSNFTFPEDWKVTRIKFDDIPEDCEMADYIIHAAGYGQPGKFTEDEASPFISNIILTDRLFEYLKPEGTFLFVSTSEVYSGAPTPNKETDIGTTTPQHPRASYIESKRCGEALCMAYSRKGYNVKIARLALAYGPGTKKGDKRVLNQFIEQALTTGEIKMRDDGSALRSYIYVKDACEIMLKILTKGKDIVYNVGGTALGSILGLAYLIAEHAHAKVTLGDTPLEGAPSEVKLDMTKTLTEFPIEITPADVGIKNTIDYQRKLYDTN